MMNRIKCFFGWHEWVKTKRYYTVKLVVGEGDYKLNDFMVLDQECCQHCRRWK
jgi:hypothetical protein